ncbi:MAG: acyl-ACP--UDP-N-acetylglucosamine O-acyltransferase [Candidatus Pacebacteria bacterium]|nr:acyl-ACP--UDP-N-acetylglucosamine O-acyltransferase [Candidatus Paceibacterota bacterium]
MTIKLHPTALVNQGAKLGEGVEIGPFCIVGPSVTLGNGVKLRSHVVVDGHTTIGKNTEVFPFAAIGLPPQDKKYKGEPTTLSIGANCVIREHCTIHIGTATGTGHTEVGDEVLFMVNSHIAHDCRIGKGVILANNATLGGHVELGDFVILGGNSAVHQFVRIGAMAMIGGMSGVEHDVIPFGLATGDRARLNGLNLIGLKRRGLAHSQIHALRDAYRRIFNGEGLRIDRIAKLRLDYGADAMVMQMVDFAAFESHRPLCVPMVSPSAAEHD